MNDILTRQLYNKLSPAGKAEVDEKMKKYIKENKFSKTNLIISLVLCLFTFWMILPLAFWIAIAIISYQRMQPEWLEDKYEEVVKEVFSKEWALYQPRGNENE